MKVFLYKFFTLIVFVAIGNGVVAQSQRDVSVYGEISEVIDFQNDVEVILTLEFGASLPPESDSDISPFSRPRTENASNKYRKVKLERSSFDNIPYEIDDLFVWGEIVDSSSGKTRYLPITKIDMPGTQAKIFSRTVGTPNSFFQNSFPISQSQTSSLPDKPMSIVRGIRLLIAEMDKLGGLDSCQFKEIATVIRHYEDFFAEGDALVVKHILDHLTLLNSSLTVSKPGGQCGTFTYPEFHAEVVNQILGKVSDRPIRGEPLWSRLVTNLEELYGTPLLMSSLPQADISIRTTVDIGSMQLCVRLSTVILQSLTEVDKDFLIRNSRNVASILNEITQCASLIRQKNSRGKNLALNNSKALKDFDGGEIVLKRYVEAVNRLNKDQVINILEGKMRNLRLHFDAFEQQLRLGEA